MQSSADRNVDVKFDKCFFVTTHRPIQISRADSFSDQSAPLTVSAFFDGTSLIRSPIVNRSDWMIDAT